MSDKKKLIKKAFLDTLPVLAGYVVLGIGFGILMKSKGYGIWWSLCMGAFIYAGSMQYLAIDLLTGGATLIVTALTTLMVNARHLFYGISMVDKYKGMGRKKPYLIYALTDETYSLVCGGAPEGVDSGKYYFLVSLFDNVYWVGGCVLGSLLGAVITFNIEGIDFALTALFVTVFIEQWMSTKDHASAIIGAVVSVLCLLIFGSGGFLIPAMLGITAVLTVMRFVKKGGRKDA